MDDLELKRFAAKFKAARDQGEAWPLLMADDVLALWARWDGTFRRTIDGRPTFARWVREQAFGRSWPPGRFKQVRIVIDRLGESCRRTWTWPAAQWVYNTVSDHELALIRRLYPEWLAENHGHPLTRDQVRRCVKAMRASVAAKTG